jgi:hypothetical protein
LILRAIDVMSLDRVSARIGRVSSSIDPSGLIGWPQSRDRRTKALRLTPSLFGRPYEIS